MTYLALHRKQLSRFSHHWLWGLSVDKIDKRGGQTFYDMAHDLAIHPEEREQIAEQIERIGRRWLFVRGLYWLFNINGYRYNYYKLQSYVSWQFYQQGVVMLSEENRVSAEQVGGFLIGVAGVALLLNPSTLYITGKLMDALRPTMIKFGMRLQAFLPTNLPRLLGGATHSDAALPTTSSSTAMLPLSLPSKANEREEAVTPTGKTYFTVTRAMESALGVLGLPQTVGTSISFKSLKTAYREGLKRCHPDKTGVNSQAEFIEVQNALNFILNSVKNSVPAKITIHVNFFSTFRADLARMEAEEFTAWQVVEEQAKKYFQHVDDYCKKVDEVRDIVAASSAAIDASCAAVKASCAAVEASCAAVEASCAAVEEYCAMVKENRELSNLGSAILLRIKEDMAEFARELAERELAEEDGTSEDENEDEAVDTQSESIEINSDDTSGSEPNDSAKKPSRLSFFKKKSTGSIQEVTEAPPSIEGNDLT